MAGIGIVFVIITVLMAGGIILLKKVINEDDSGRRLISALIMCGFFFGAIAFSAIYGTVTERQAQKIKLQNTVTEKTVITTEKTLLVKNLLEAK